MVSACYLFLFLKKPFTAIPSTFMVILKKEIMRRILEPKTDAVSCVQVSFYEFLGVKGV